MKMKNYEIEGLLEWLVSLNLAGRESRMRTRFVKLVGLQLDVIENERKEITKKYCEKNESGEPAVTTDLDNNKTTFKIQQDKIETYNKEILEILNEEYVIDELEERKEILESVRDIILNTEEKFNGMKAMVYDRWCEIFEDIYK